VTDNWQAFTADLLDPRPPRTRRRNDHHGPNATEPCPVCKGFGLVFPPDERGGAATIRRCPEWPKEDDG
jgi:hypothetical protein